MLFSPQRTQGITEALASEFRYNASRNEKRPGTLPGVLAKCQLLSAVLPNVLIQRLRDRVLRAIPHELLHNLPAFEYK